LNHQQENEVRPQSIKRLLWVFGVSGLLFRLVFVIVTQDIGGAAALDAGTYHSIALNMLEGRGFSQDSVNPSLFVAPLYPFFLAGVYGLAGVHPLLVEILQAVLGTLAALVLYLLARDLFGRVVGVIAFVLALFMPDLFVLNTFLYTETLFIFLFVLAVWLAMRALREPSWKHLAIAGFIGGLTTLTRGVTLLLPLLLMISLLLHYRFRDTLRPVVVYALFFILPIVPWTLRNYHTFHAVVPVAVGSGDVLWTGNYLPLDGKYSYEKTMVIMDSMTVGLNQVDRDKLLTREALNNMKAEPLATAGLWVRKFFRFWFWVYEGAPTGSKRQGGSLVQWILALSYYPVLLLFAAGVWLSRKRWRDFFFLYLLLAYYVAAHVALLVVPRYRFPILPLMVLFASLAIREFWRMRSTP
jgi:4-amino-4-deoxy-L-arabinose transferase-like glycosyltransferase